MGSRREIIAFCAVPGRLRRGVFSRDAVRRQGVEPGRRAVGLGELSRRRRQADYEPANRLLMDPVLQFQPWLEFNRRMIRSGRLPLWNGYAGCGAPHLANGQSAVFDPFHLLAYLGPTPRSLCLDRRGAAVGGRAGNVPAGRSWGLGLWGRWFAGLVYPFCGFLVVWLLFPVTAVAIWMPWLFLATDRRVPAPGGRGGGLAGGRRRARHLGRAHPDECPRAAGGRSVRAGAGLWRERTSAARRGGPSICWTLGTCLGLGLSAVQILPLGFYLAKSPVWSDRQRERPAVVDDRSAPAARRGLHGGSLCLRKPAPGSSQPGASPGRAQPERVGGRLRRAGDLDLAGSAGGRHARPLASGRVPDRAGGLRGHGGVSLAAGRQPAARPARARRHRQPPAHALGRVRLDAARAGSASTSSGRSRRLPRGWLVALGRGRRSFWARWPARSARSSRSSASGPSPIIARPRRRRRAPIRAPTGSAPSARCGRPSHFCRATMRSWRSSWPCWPRSRLALRRAGAMLALDSTGAARADACSTWPCSASASTRRSTASYTRSSRR